MGSPYLRAWVRERRRLLLAAILAVAACIRIWTLLGLRASMYRDYLFTDERGYHEWAKNLAQGVPQYLCHISPLPAYYMAAIYRLFGVDPVHIRYANVVLGVLTCWVLVGIGCRIGGTLVGLLSGLIAALYRPFIFLSITVLKEPLVLLSFSLMVFCFLGELKRHRFWQTLCLGITFGLIVVLRPNAGVAALIMALVVCSRAARSARSRWSFVYVTATLALGTLIPVAPFMAKNYLAAGQLTPAPQGGVELYLGNNSVADRPYYTPASFATPSPEEQGIHFRIEASRRVGRMLTFAEASSYWAHQVANQARSAPLSCTRRLLRKTIAMLNAREESDNHSIEFLSSFIPCLQWPLLSYPLVMPLGVAGVILGVKNLRARGALTLLAVIIAYGATLVILYCNLRLRVPLLVVLIPFSSAVLVRLMRRERTQKCRVAFTAMVAFLVLVEHWPLVGGPDMTAHYNTHASLLLERGDERGAVVYWRKSQLLKGAFSDFATLALGRLALERSDVRSVRELLETISDDSFSAALKYDLLGDALSRANSLTQAATAYEKSLSINSARRDTRHKLLSIYQVINSRKAQQQAQELTYIEGFFTERE